ncbi:fimbria/pilus outer membrane usher protein [Klebsiella aerogenes]
MDITIRKAGTLFLMTSSLFVVSEKCFAVKFNTNFLVGQSGKSDLSRFYTSSDLPPGKYNVDLYVNNDWKGHFDITVKDSAQDLYLDADDLPRLGLKTEGQPEHNKVQTALPLAEYLHGGKAELDATNLSLRINVPQAYVKSELKGYVDPAFWDQGIPGAMLSYNANYYHTQNKHAANNSNDDNAYISLNSGINLLGWQLRDQSTYQYTKSSGSKWVNNTRYLQRGIAALNAELRVGDSYTMSEMFDSFRYRGASLHTDMRMYPDAYQGFAPIIRGIAQTNALVKVSQNGMAIFQTNVPPGPFALDNILPTGSGGDLDVEVIEADGRSNKFIVPFASVPNMLKPGMVKYDITAGQTRIPDNSYNPKFLQASYQYGMSNLLTGYTATIISEDYISLLLGSGFNLPIGAVSLDISQSDAKFKDGERLKGTSYKLAYSKFLSHTGTNFALAAYRYSTRNYLTLTDAINMHQWIDDGYDSQNYARQKNTFNVNVNQQLGQGLGSFFISGTLRDYWGGNGKNKEYQLGYANSIGKINYTLSASRVRYSGNGESSREEQRYYLGLTIPFSLFDSPSYLTSIATMNDGHYDNSNIGISGSSGPSGRLTYGINVSDQRQSATTGSVNLSYKAPIATVNGAYSESRDFRQAGFGATGSIVAYQGGILTANQVGDTFAIVDAPGTTNASVNGNRNIVTNSSGKVLVPYLSPYRKNAIMLDTSNTPEDAAELKGNIRDVVPYSGAITYLGFKTDQRKTFVFYANQRNGNPLPFGNEVTDGKGNSIGYVGQGSMVFIRAEKMPDIARITISRKGNEQCTIHNPKSGQGAAANPCL